MNLSRGLLLAVLSWCLFSGASYWMRDKPRLDAEAELLRVRLPLLVQLAYSGGDGYLAANTNVFRSIMVGVNVTEPETYRVQAQLQVDAAHFNPWHEDNYYLSAAILPWNGRVEEAQSILHRAAQARQWDMWPAFYYAFNAMYFERDMARAGQWAEIAATRHPRNAPALRAMAAAWYERGDDPRVAMQILEDMYAGSQDKSFRDLLAARYRRLQGLLALREAAIAYRALHGSNAQQLEQLVGHAGLKELPADPLGLGYVLDADGDVQLADHVTRTKRQ